MHVESRTTTIDAAPEAVWRVLADFRSISRWAPNVDHSCLLSPASAGEGGLGVVRRVQVGPMTILERIIVWEPGARLAYALEGLPKAVRSAVNEWTLTAAGPSATTVTLSTSLDLGPRPPQQLAAKAVGRKMGAANQQLVDGLRAYCSTLGHTS